MLHFKNCLGISFRQPWLFPVARFATTAAAAGAPTPPFAIEDYLVATYGLTAAQAAKAVGRAKTLSRLESPAQPDAVLAFLSGLGLSIPDIAAAIVRDPYLLCCSADKTLAPRVAELRDLDLGPSQIARFVVLAPASFRHPDIIPKLQYFILLFGSLDNFLRALRKSSYLLGANLERVIKPNVTCLRECTLSAREISKMSIVQPRLLYSKQEHLRAILARAEGIGIPRGTPMFLHALIVSATRNTETIAAKMEVLKKTFRWSDAQVASVVSRCPSVLTISEDKAQRVSEFLFSEVGLHPESIAGSPTLITFSLVGRLMPRHYVVKFLKANGLLEHDRSYYTAVNLTEMVFVQKYIHPYKGIAPHLAEDYADACRGEMPSRFRLQEPGTGLASA